MVRCGFKTGNVAFFETYNQRWFHKFCVKLHSQKRCCGVSSYNSQKDHLDWEIIPK